MGKKIVINEIFSGLGIPSQTYVAQENGEFEKQLTQGIKELGTLCLVTGSSKTGKTTLYNKVLNNEEKTPIVIRCDATIDANEFWKRPLEAIDFRRLKEVHAQKTKQIKGSAKIGGKLSWQWLADLLGEASIEVSGTNSELKIKEAILAKPSPSHLIPVLKNTNAVLVVEDFHYLNESTQKQIFQQWKVFTDDMVSVIVVGTTHHGVDLAHANSDLIGRIQQINLKRWKDVDLLKIVHKGFNELDIHIQSSISNIISKESVGLPIITQQVCGQIFIDKGMTSITKSVEINITKQDSYNALHNVAVTRYKQFESWYTRITTGPRKAARKYNTYELVLSSFTLDPLKFNLSRDDLEKRISSMPVTKKPPKASITSTLSALGNFQKNNGFELLEWSKRDQVIYVIEPAFLYYLRWREPKKGATDLSNGLKVLFDIFGIKIDLKKVIEKSNSNK